MTEGEFKRCIQQIDDDVDYWEHESMDVVDILKVVEEAEKEFPIRSKMVGADFEYEVDKWLEKWFGKEAPAE